MLSFFLKYWLDLELYVKSATNLNVGLIYCFLIPEFGNISCISLGGPFPSAGFKAESARDFYECAAAGSNGQLA